MAVPDGSDHPGREGVSELDDAAAGLRVADVTAVSWAVRSAALAEQVFRFGDFVERIGTPRARRWLEELYAQEADGALVAAATGFIVVGVKP